MRSNSNAWHSSGVSRMGDNRLQLQGSLRCAGGGLACSLPESWLLRSAPPSARAHAAQFRANRHPAASADATGLRVDLVEDEVKPGEEENNKVRRRELLSFFTG